MALFKRLGEFDGDAALLRVWSDSLCVWSKHTAQVMSIANISTGDGYSTIEAPAVGVWRRSVQRCAVGVMGSRLMVDADS